MKLLQVNRKSGSAVVVPVKRRKAEGFRTSGTLLAGIVGALAILGLLLLVGSTPSSEAAGDVSLVAVDMNTAGNTTVSCAGEGCAPGTLGTIQTCAAVSVGGTVNVDIVVDAIPNAVAGSGAGPNIQGFDMDLMYNPSFVQVSAVPANGPGGPPGNLDINYAATPGGPQFSTTNLAPDTDGDFYMGEVDVGPTGESGKGILMRLTLKGVTAGTSILHLQDNTNASPVPSLYDNSGLQNTYTIGANQDAMIVVGGSCATSPTTGQFCIFGASTGVTWYWTVTGTPGPFSGSASFGAGGAASDIANAWVNSMNGPTPAFGSSGLTANTLAGQPHCFEITPWNPTLTLMVDSCPVTTSGCSFNPTVYAVSPVGGIAELRVSDGGGQAATSQSAATTSFPFGALGGALAMGAAALVTGLWYVRRRWVR